VVYAVLGMVATLLALAVYMVSLRAAASTYKLKYLRERDARETLESTLENLRFAIRRLAKTERDVRRVDADSVLGLLQHAGGEEGDAAAPGVRDDPEGGAGEVEADHGAARRVT